MLPQSSQVGIKLTITYLNGEQTGVGSWAMGGETRKDLEFLPLETSSNFAHCLHCVTLCARGQCTLTDFISRHSFSILQWARKQGSEISGLTLCTTHMYIAKLRSGFRSLTLQISCSFCCSHKKKGGQGAVKEKDETLKETERELGKEKRGNSTDRVKCFKADSVEFLASLPLHFCSSSLSLPYMPVFSSETLRRWQW